MSYNWDHLIDGVVVVAYLLCLIVGFYRGKQISGIVRYVLGRCTISTFTLICAFFATHVGAGVVMGTVKRVWNMGALFIITQLFNPIIWFLNAMIYASTVERLRDYLTIICVTKRPMSPISAGL